MRIYAMWFVLVLIALEAGRLSAQTVVAPSGNLAAEGASSNSPTLSTGPQTVQFHYHRSQLTGIPGGSAISAMAMRLNAGMATVSTDLTFTQFDVQVSRSDATTFANGTLSNFTFSANQSAPIATVRSGALTIPANTLTGGAGPNAFTFILTFTTPYTYATNTDIVVLIRHSGTGVVAVPALDAATGALNVSSGGNAAGASASTATGSADAPVMRFTYSAPAPEIDLQTPSGTGITDNTTHAVGTTAFGVPMSFNYVIRNTGAANLMLTLPMAAPGGLANCTASINTQPASANVFPGAQASFALTVNVSAAGPFSCTLSLMSNDPDEGNYNWTLSGSGAANVPEVDVYRIVSGDAADGATDAVGTLNTGANYTYTYTVSNSGTGPLTLSGIPAVVTSGQVNCVPAIITQPAGSVGVGASATFILQVRPVGGGAFSVDVVVANNDPNEPGYTFTVSGTGDSGMIAAGGGGGGGCSVGAVEPWAVAPWAVLLLAVFAARHARRRSAAGRRN